MKESFPDHLHSDSLFPGVRRRSIILRQLLLSDFRKFSSILLIFKPFSRLYITVPSPKGISDRCFTSSLLLQMSL